MNPHNSSTESSTTGEKNNSEKQNGNRSRWLSYLAVFGDSGFALVTSFALLVVAVTVALFLDEEQTGDLSASDEKAYRALGPIPKLEPPRIFDFTSTTKEASSTSDGVFVSDEMRKAFEKDGVIAIRGLIDADLLNLLDISSKDLVREPQQQNELKPKGPLNSRTRKKGTQFFTVKQGAIFLPENNTTDLSAFSKVSLMSKIPLIAADLLQLKEERHETLRLMRDIFLAKDEEEYICGWHVDDTGFWPNTAEASGVNAWMALDDMPVELGGGFALAVGSHNASWRDEAYHVTGSTHTFPKEGFQSAMDFVEKRVGNGTCNIQTAAPHLHRRMEETKRIYDIKRGDIIFHTRWLFHRTVAFERDAVADRISKGGADDQPLLYRRYSIRYGPGYSEIPKGFGLEPSVLWDEKNAGRTADEVSALDAPWYPKVWPSVSHDELKRMRMIAEERMPTTLVKVEARRKLIKAPRRNTKNRQVRQPH